jgi:HTH-type transcriptional regulator / antitoxin HigA
MTLTFDAQSYGTLLLETLPQTIENEEEYDRTLAVVEKLHKKKQQRTPEESTLYKLLVILIENYETQEYPMPASPPSRILQHILESSGMAQADLVGWLGTDSVVEALLTGQRPIDSTQAQLLADRFNVSIDLFIPSGNN